MSKIIDAPNFNSYLAYEMYGVTTERELRNAVYGARSALSDIEFQCLTESLDLFDSPVYVEIGVYFGGTFAAVMNYLRLNAKSYTAIGIDLFESILEHDEFSIQTHELVNKWNMLNVAEYSCLNDRLTEMGHRNFRLMMGNSDDLVHSLPELIDVALIDGNHTYEQAMKDFEAVLGRSHKGTRIVFDNASKSEAGDKKYFDADGGPWKVCADVCESKRDVIRHVKSARCAQVLEVL